MQIYVDFIIYDLKFLWCSVLCALVLPVLQTVHGHVAKAEELRGGVLVRRKLKRRYRMIIYMTYIYDIQYDIWQIYVDFIIYDLKFYGVPRV